MSHFQHNKPAPGAAENYVLPTRLVGFERFDRTVPARNPDQEAALANTAGPFSTPEDGVESGGVERALHGQGRH